MNEVWIVYNEGENGKPLMCTWHVCASEDKADEAMEKYDNGRKIKSTYVEDEDF